MSKSSPHDDSPAAARAEQGDDSPAAAERAKADHALIDGMLRVLIGEDVRYRTDVVSCMVTDADGQWLVSIVGPTRRRSGVWDVETRPAITTGTAPRKRFKGVGSAAVYAAKQIPIALARAAK